DKPLLRSDQLLEAVGHIVKVFYQLTHLIELNSACSGASSQISGSNSLRRSAQANDRTRQVTRQKGADKSRNDNGQRQSLENWTGSQRRFDAAQLEHREIAG